MSHIEEYVELIALVERMRNIICNIRAYLFEMGDAGPSVDVYLLSMESELEQLSSMVNRWLIHKEESR